MNLTFEPNLMLQVIYRLNLFDRVFISHEWAKERIFSVVESNHPDELAQVKESLLDYYGVSDKQSMFEAVREYDDEFIQVFMTLLYVAYERLGEQIGTLSFEKFRAEFMQDEAVGKAASVFLINVNADEFANFRENLELCAQYHFGELVDKNGVKGQNLIPKIAKFFAQMAEFYALAPRTGLAGFDYARVVQIITQSFAVGYISKQECEDGLETYGNAVRKIFSGWDEYIASFLLGSAYMKMFQSDEDIDCIEAISERILAVSVALNSPFDMLKESGIWSENLGDAKARLNAVLAKFLDKKADLEEQKNADELVGYMEESAKNAGFSLESYRQSLDVYTTCFHNSLKQNGVDTLEAMIDDTFLFTPLHEMSDDYTFYGAVGEFLQKTKTKLASDEYPIMLIYTSNLTLFTNAGIYIYSGMMFFKKVKFYSWKEANFNATISSLGALRCFVDEKEYFDIELAEYEKLIGKNSNAEKDEREAMFKDEIEALISAMNALKRRLGA